jgi:hypothetical protein
LPLPSTSTVKAAGSTVLALVVASPFASAQGYLVHQFGGSGELDRIGWSVARAGDLDGDGVADIAVGAPQSSLAGTPFAGQAKIFSGSTGAVLFTFNGTASNTSFGVSVAAAGDIDADGIPDVIVGATGGLGLGYARVLDGSNGGTLFSFTGTASGDYFGSAVAGLGDVNGDGLGDVAVGAVGSNQYAGAVKVFSGANGAVVHALNGPGPNHLFGAALVGPGDLDGDGFSDLVVGAPGSFTLTPLPGMVQAFSGATGTVLYTITGAAANEHFGVSLDVAGDLNGDAVPDLATGALGYTGPGYVRVSSGANGSLLLTISGTTTNDSFGRSLAGVGDVNSDGIPDLAVGVPLSGNIGEARIYSGGSGALLFTFPGSTGEQWFGFAVAGPGDLNDDGFPELVATNPYFPAGGLWQAGQVRVFSIAGIPFGSALFGAGCPGSGGIVPLLRTAGGPATSAGSPAFAILFSKALGGAPALLVLGTSFQSWIGTPLPLNLGMLGMPGCSLLVSADVLISTSTSGSGPGAGAASLPMPVPTSPSLAFTFVHLQGYVVDPGPTPIPGAMTQGLKLLIQ